MFIPVMQGSGRDRNAREAHRQRNGHPVSPVQEDVIPWCGVTRPDQCKTSISIYMHTYIYIYIIYIYIYN